MNLALINPKVWATLILVAVVGFAGWYGYNWSYDRGADTVQRKWDAVKAEQDQESARVAASALDTTKKLQESADNQRKSYDAQIRSINKSLDNALAGLRERPPRPSAGNLPTDTGKGTGCTGAELYRADGEFLTRESARAERLRIKLESCEADYARAAAALK